MVVLVPGRVRIWFHGRTGNLLKLTRGEPSPHGCVPTAPRPRWVTCPARSSIGATPRDVAEVLKGRARPARHREWNPRGSEVVEERTYEGGVGPGG